MDYESNGDLISIAGGDNQSEMYDEWLIYN